MKYAHNRDTWPSLPASQTNDLCSLQMLFVVARTLPLSAVRHNCCTESVLDWHEQIFRPAINAQACPTMQCYLLVIVLLKPAWFTI